ncbi:MAG: ABC transporter substrate-binding protein, partial [Lachnospiraceae bacterium]
YAIDKDAINDFIFGGRGQLIGTSMLPDYECYVDGLGYEHDTAKAKALLAEAGYPDGFDMEITVPSNYQIHLDTAQVIVEQLKEAGINASIKSVDWSTWLDEVYKGRDFQTTVCGIAGSLTPSYLLVRYQSTAKNNFVNYYNEEFDTLYKKISTSLDSGEVTEGYRTLQTMLAEDAASVYIAVPPVLIAMDKTLGGYRFYPIYVQDMKYVYWTE